MIFFGYFIILSYICNKDKSIKYKKLWELIIMQG